MMGNRADNDSNSPDRGPALLHVTVRYHNLLRHRAGVEQEILAVAEGTSLLEALGRLAGDHDPSLGKVLLTPDGDISPQIVVFHNGQLARLDPSGPTLAEGDEIKLLPKISGGS